MKKTSRFVLEEDEEEGFDIIGICTTLKEYKIAWLLNQVFDWTLQHSMEPIKIPSKKSIPEDPFDYYIHASTDESFLVYLLKNKQNGKNLSIEYPQLDYLLVVKENLTVEIDELLNKLRNQSQIMAAYKYDNTDFGVSDFLQFE